MACIHHMYAFTFLLALTACHQVLFTEGRQLKTLKKDKFDSTQISSQVVINSKQRYEEKTNHFQFTSKKENSPASRPKGSFDDLKDHSPGIGHSFQNKNIVGTNVR
ncbi:hypothetical protein H5410_014517 [Solanum commersonii]|uniref:Uncharacterized protein n=1 Tax=Solanum commersonii TaxID=4109 RepID=A0A9J5ZR39_SOLCO|nr:hypothetical protein H5410_014517 [Solanum commersonii]